MSTTRATLLICATIFASIFGITYYGYQQDQFVISSGVNYVAILDKKSKTVNLCDRGNCTLITPRFPEPGSHSTAMQSMRDLGSFASRIFNPQQAGGQQGMPQQGPNGQQLLGSFPQQMPMNQQMNPQMQQGNMIPQQMDNPQMMGNPQMMSSPQMNPQMVHPQMISGTPQAADPLTAVKADDAAPDEADEETVPV